MYRSPWLVGEWENTKQEGGVPGQEHSSGRGQAGHPETCGWTEGRGVWEPHVEEPQQWEALTTISWAVPTGTYGDDATIS